MAAVASILPTEYSRPEELTIQAQQSRRQYHQYHQQHYANTIQKENQNVNELNDDEANEDIVLLSPANTASSSSSDDATISYPQTPTQKIFHYPDDGTAINTTRAEATHKDFEYNTVDDEAIMKSYLDPSPVSRTSIIKNGKKGLDLNCLNRILKDDGNDNNSNRENITATAAKPLSLSSLSLSSPPPRSPSRSSNATLTTYTPQLDTSKIIDHSSDSSPSHNQEHEQKGHQHQRQFISNKNNNNNCRSGGSNIRSMSSSSESTCSSTVSSYSTVATSTASNKQHIAHGNVSSPNHQYQQPATKLSALAVHAAKRSERYHFEHHQQNQQHKLTSVRPMPTSSSRFKTALQIFRSNNNNKNTSNSNSPNNNPNHNDTSNNNDNEPEAYHYHHLSQGSVSRNSIAPSRASERIPQDTCDDGDGDDDKEQPINVVPSKSKSLAGRLKSKFQKKATSDSKNNSNGGSTGSFTVNMSRSASLSSITSSWSRLTQSRSGDYSKQNKQQIKLQHVVGGPTNQQHQPSQQYLSAVIQNRDNNRESTSSIYHSSARHSMYCTPTPINTVSNDHRIIYHVQQEQKHGLHTSHHHQIQQQQHSQNDNYRQQQRGQQYQRSQYHRFRHQKHCHPQMVSDTRLESSISTPPAAKKSSILGDPTKLSMDGSFITASNITARTVSSGGKNGNMNCNNTVRFARVVSVRETYARHEYDRGSDPDAVCTRLTPAMAYFIKEELNTYKLHEMQVHECSRENTHFFF